MRVRFSEGWVIKAQHIMAVQHHSALRGSHQLQEERSKKAIVPTTAVSRRGGILVIMSSFRVCAFEDGIALSSLSCAVTLVSVLRGERNWSKHKQRTQTHSLHESEYFYFESANMMHRTAGLWPHSGQCSFAWSQ